MAEKAECDCTPYEPKKKALTDSEIDELERYYPELPEDVDVTTEARVDVDGDKPGYIYVFREELKSEKPTGFYKVGRSGKPSVRRQNLKAGNYRYLNITEICPVDDVVRAEADAHRALKGYHVQVPSGGIEWYRVDSNQEIEFYDVLAEAISKYKAV